MKTTDFYFLHTSFCFFIFLNMQTSQSGSDPAYIACSSMYSCGSIQNISYPFWGGNRPLFCGLMEFLLTCNNTSDYPTIPISRKGYVRAEVFSIITSTHKISAALYQFADGHPICRAPYMYPKLKFSTSFKFSSSVGNITLFYGCSSFEISQYKPKSFSCAYLNGTKGSGFYFRETSEIIRRKTQLCEVNYTVPVLKKELDELNNGNGTVLSVLQKGFEMEYIANFTTCSTCESSGGRCGTSDSRPSEFVCYCPDGPEPFTCPNSGRTKFRLIVASVSSLAGIGLMLIIIVFCFKMRKSSTYSRSFWKGGIFKKNEKVEAFLRDYGSITPKRYTYSNIRKMTGAFKDKLGEGGFGGVYKGKLEDGRLVAVKLLKEPKGDGQEFINEVASISRTKHVNIITLVGFCFQGQKRALVYEFMPNGSLDKFIYGGNNTETLPWETLFNISVGIARGLDYLHRGCTTPILHFDIKPHNILLDEDFHPKISDFGLARLCPQKESIISMLEARGTIGYIAPEVFCRSLGGPSHKSDVYSYGMMILELVGARKHMSSNVQSGSSELYFPRWIHELLEPGDGPSCLGDMNSEEIELQRKIILVSLWCIQSNPSSRPSINRVVEMLEGSLDSLQIPSMPSFSSPSGSIQATSGLTFDSDVNVNSSLLSSSLSRV